MDVPCPASIDARVYRPRQPRESPLYRLVERSFDEFNCVYAGRYQKRYGFWRPVVADAAAKFLPCGDLRHGFARVRCGTCRHEFLVATGALRNCRQVVRVLRSGEGSIPLALRILRTVVGERR